MLDRTDNPNYSDFKNDALRVNAIAKVFPVFFLVVAALVCLNTMSRMVEEERTQIGIFKALGYSNFKIMFCYIFYVSIATLFGGIIGLLIGYQVLPRTIYGIYSFTYYLPDIIIYINPIHFILIIIIALLLTNLVTMFSCYKELKEVPALLLRPKAPKAGKKVILEKIGFIWNKINFSGKVTIRNLNSIDQNLESLLTDNNLINPLLVKQEMYSFKANDKNHDFYIFVASDTEQLKDYVTLRNRGTKKVSI